MRQGSGRESEEEKKKEVCNIACHIIKQVKKQGEKSSCFFYPEVERSRRGFFRGVSMSDNSGTGDKIRICSGYFYLLFQNDIL